MINHLLAFLTATTLAFTPVNSPVIQAQNEGDAGFVGMLATPPESDEPCVVVAILKGTPAADSGIELGDSLISLDGQNVQAMTNEQYLAFIRGDVGTNLYVVYQHGGQVKKLILTRVGVKPYAKAFYELIQFTGSQDIIFYVI